jgi:hypothetical protein
MPRKKRASGHHMSVHIKEPEHHRATAKITQIVSTWQDIVLLISRLHLYTFVFNIHHYHAKSI